MSKRKAINFDLDTKKLKQHYPNRNYRQAYKDIKSFLENNGFKHRQFSGYISNTEISDTKMIKIVNSLQYKFSWFGKCVRRFDVTDIGKEYDMTKYINTDNTKSRHLDIDKNSPMANKQNEPQKHSLLKKLDEKQAEIDSNQTLKNLSINKNKDNIER